MKPTLHARACAWRPRPSTLSQGRWSRALETLANATPVLETAVVAIVVLGFLVAAAWSGNAGAHPLTIVAGAVVCMLLVGWLLSQAEYAVAWAYRLAQACLKNESWKRSEETENLWRWTVSGWVGAHPPLRAVALAWLADPQHHGDELTAQQVVALWGLYRCRALWAPTFPSTSPAVPWADVQRQAVGLRGAAQKHHRLTAALAAPTASPVARAARL